MDSHGKGPTWFGRKLSKISAAITRWQGQLYQPPQTNIDTTDWPSPWVPIDSEAAEIEKRTREARIRAHEEDLGANGPSGPQFEGNEVTAKGAETNQEKVAMPRNVPSGTDLKARSWEDIDIVFLTDFRSAKRDLDQKLHDDLQRDLDSINRDFPRVHSQRAVRIEDACCGHLARTAKKYWQELLEPASLSPQRRSELFRRAINEAFQEIGACARTGGVYETVESFRNEFLQKDSVRSEGSQTPQAKPIPSVHENEPAAANDNERAKVQARTWKEVEISFFNEHSVQITVGENRRIHQYDELGMADQRTGKPTLAWEMLLILAKQKGVVDHSLAQVPDWDTVEKRIQEIKKWVCERFGISSNPLPYIRGSGYRAEFRVKCAPSFQE